jgi:UDP-GlcNAc:undecaprenyl-phosphate/decaprenyl-phosphate GlcNAc-1-phosphate transferase
LDEQIQFLALMACLGFVVTYLLVPVTKRLARNYAFLAYPGGRKIHSDPIPVLGGVAIFAPHILVFSGYLYLVFTGSSLIDRSEIQKFIALFLATVWILILGVVDDKSNLGWRNKLFGQIFAIGILFIGGHTIGKIVIPFYGLVDLGLLGYPLLGFIVLLVMNAVNLIDGMDGLAAGLCFFAAATCGTLAFYKNELLVATICLTTAGSLLAFLRFNFPPATIFMGDSGSLSLGFMLSVLATSNIVKGSSQRYSSLTTFIALLLPFAVALLDVALAVARRWISGRKIFLPDADHLHHRFIEMFKRPRLVIGIFYIFSALFCSLTLLLTLNPESYSTLVVGSITVVALVGIMAMVLKLYRVDRIANIIKNRHDCMFLSTFNSYKEIRIQRAKSTDELMGLLESGVRDLDFDRVEVNMNGSKPMVWNNTRAVHPESPKRIGFRTFKDSAMSAQWVIPTHDDHDYQKYLELVWHRFLNAVDEKQRELNH